MQVNLGLPLEFDVPKIGFGDKPLLDGGGEALAKIGRGKCSQVDTFVLGSNTLRY